MQSAVDGVRRLFAKGNRQPSHSLLAVTLEHTICLAAMLDRPNRYRQRCLDQVSFLRTGGQQWRRTLQTKIPKDAKPDGSAWRIVSLGEYKRRRFPDFTITDAQGMRLNRLTRQQHGIALTRAILATHFFSLPKKQLDNLKKDKKARRVYERLRDDLFRSFTSVGDIPEPKYEKLVEKYYTQLYLFARLCGGLL